VPKSELKVLNCGYYYAAKNALLDTWDSESVWGPALFFLIQHPERGPILFDTGYHSRYFAFAKHPPYNVLDHTIPVRVNEEEHAINQLQKLGISPNEVTVILSHMHIDHLAGIQDFSDSTIYINKVEWEFCQKPADELVKHFYMKPLFENINKENVKLVDFEANGKPYGPFENTIDLFDDESIILVPLPGHTIGQMGLILNISSIERYFLVADAAYVRENYRTERTGAITITHFDVEQYKKWLPLLKQLEETNPGITILPSHDPAVYETYIGPLPKE
jgi:glyoxylase-like metal-dependent hydrolase (beta-lactamase superfamily II)